MDYSIKEDAIECLFDRIKGLIVPSEKSGYRSKFLQSNFLLYFVVLFSALKILATVSSINFPQNILFADITKSVLENSVNQTRQSQGLQPLAENEKLDQAAQLKADNMVQDNYFDHTSPTGVTPWYWFLKAGYVYQYAGENLAIGFYDSKEVFDAWLNSPSHKANILNPNYTEIGTAIVNGFGSGNTIVVVQEFASPSAEKQIIVNPSPKPIVETSQPQDKTPANAVETVPAANTQAPAANTGGGKVLSQTTEAPNSISPQNASGTNDLYSQLANFILYDYEVFLQYVVGGMFLLVASILFVLTLFNYHVNFKKQFVFRAILIIGILSAATLVNRELILSLIPHQIII